MPRCPYAKVAAWAYVGILGRRAGEVVTCFVGSSLRGQRPRTQSLHLRACPFASFTNQTSLTTWCPAYNPRFPTSHLPQGPSSGGSDKGQEPPLFWLDVSVIGRQGDGPDDPVRSMGPAELESMPRTHAACRADLGFEAGIKLDQSSWEWPELRPKCSRTLPGAVLAGSYLVPGAPGAHSHVATLEKLWLSGIWALPPLASPHQSR